MYIVAKEVKIEKSIFRFRTACFVSVVLYVYVCKYVYMNVYMYE